MNQALATLEQLQLITYNHESVGRPGKHGTYHELYQVNQISAPQMIAANDTVKALSGTTIDEEILDDIALPGVHIPPQLTGGKEEDAPSPQCYDGHSWFDKDYDGSSYMRNIILEYPQENAEYIKY